jgi:hypothetical protein
MVLKKDSAPWSDLQNDGHFLTCFKSDFAMEDARIAAIFHRYDNLSNLVHKHTHTLKLIYWYLSEKKIRSPSHSFINQHVY